MDSLIVDAQGFLRALGANNTRDWFQAHKADYDTRLRDPARRLLDVMTPRLEDLTGYPITSKLFRPNRDVRFSKDKTPYKTHLHMMWTPDTGARQNPALFFGIDAQTVTVATGMMTFEKEVLADWRKMLDLDGAYIAGKIAPALQEGYALWPPALKRVPAPFGKDHAFGDLLRHKGLVVGGHPDLSGALHDKLVSSYEAIWPVSDMLIGVAEAPRL